MPKILALTTDGRITKCSCPPDKRGIGRCNHILHKNDNETEDDFIIRCSKYLKENISFSYEKLEDENIIKVPEIAIDVNNTKIFPDDIYQGDASKFIGGTQRKTITIDGKYIKQDVLEYNEDGTLNKVFSYPSTAEVVCSLLIRNSDVFDYMRAANYYMATIYDEKYNKISGTISPSFKYIYESEYTLAPLYGAGSGETNLMRNDEYRDCFIDSLKTSSEKRKIIIDSIVQKFGKDKCDIKKLERQFDIKCALDILFQNKDIVTNPSNFVVIRTASGEPEIVHMDYGRCLNFGSGDTFLSYEFLRNNFNKIKINTIEMKKQFNEMYNNTSDENVKYMLSISFDNLMENLKKYPNLWEDIV